MNIRQKITLLITGVGFLASLVLADVVFLEMVEQPFRIIDSEWAATGLMAARIILTGKEKTGLSPAGPIFPESHR